jgi:CBS domain containing-hemolysin-like protein
MSHTQLKPCQLICVYLGFFAAIFYNTKNHFINANTSFNLKASTVEWDSLTCKLSKKTLQNLSTYTVLLFLTCTKIGMHKALRNKSIFTLTTRRMMQWCTKFIKTVQNPVYRVAKFLLKKRQKKKRKKVKQNQKVKFKPR